MGALLPSGDKLSLYQGTGCGAPRGAAGPSRGRSRGPVPLERLRLLAGVSAGAATNSWATPIAATPERPRRLRVKEEGRITSILRSALPNRTTGMWSSRANCATAFRNANPIFSKIAGDGIGFPLR